MRRDIMHWNTWTLFILAIYGITTAALPPFEALPDAIRTRGGFCVVVGTEDGVLEASLTAGGRTLVQGLALSESAALQSRKHLFESGLYPLASISYVDSAVKLPYTDNLVNFLIADLDALGAKGPSMDEINRVLGYDARAYVKRNGHWLSHYVPIPPDVNEYTHWKDDSTLNSYQADHRAGIPNQVRWIGAPSPTVRDSNNNTVSCAESERVTGGVWTGTYGAGTWGKDAFSGVFLWKREYPEYAFGSHRTGRNRCWAANDRYLFGYTKSIGEGLVAYDLRSGAIKRRYTTFSLRSQVDRRGRTGPHRWDRALLSIAHTLLHEGNLVQIIGNKVWYLDQESGEVHWHWEAPGDSTTIVGNGLIQDSVLAVAVTHYQDTAPGHDVFGPTRTYYADFGQIVGFNIHSGEVLWTLDELPHGQKLFQEMIAGGAGRCLIAYTDRESFHCLDLHSGRIVWSTDEVSAYDNGSYRGNITQLPDRELVVFSSFIRFSVHDLGTGALRQNEYLDAHFGGDPSSTITPGHLLIGDKYVGLEQLTTESDVRFKMPIIGGSGQNYTPVVAYGSTYRVGTGLFTWPFLRTLPAHSCAQKVRPVIPESDSDRLHLAGGNASSIEGELPSQADAWDSEIAYEWTEQCLGRHIPRSEITCQWEEPKPRREYLNSGDMLRRWRPMPAWTGLARRETAHIEAEDDLSVFAVVHEHRLTARRDSGTVWNFIADARITGDPVTDDKNIYFGAHDGYVYAVDRETGALVWRFLAAPDDIRMVAFSQVESLWPVFGIVLHENRIYATAGRLPGLDGGIQAYCLNASDGALLWHIENLSGHVDESVTGRSGADIRDCTEGAEMSDIFSWNLNYAINDQPYLENGLLMIPDWHIDIDSPRDTIWFAHQIGDDFGNNRHDGKYKTVTASQMNRFTIEIAKRTLKVSARGEGKHLVHITDAQGRCILSRSLSDSQEKNICLEHLPVGVYFAVIRADGVRSVMSRKMTFVN